MASIVKPDSDRRNLFYPDPDNPGGITEIDALLIVDDILFLVEIKAGAFSDAANRGAPGSLFDELSDTIGTGQRQSERAERYIKSADEVPFFDESGKQELLRLRRSAFRQIFRVVITREDLGWVGARIAILSLLDPAMSKSFPWHVSLDDLRIVAEMFKDSELRFIHFLEQRLKAAAETIMVQHDEIEHISLYNKINHYHELPVPSMDRMTYDPSYMRDIDLYFAEKSRGKSPDLPKQKIPSGLDSFLQAVRDSRLPGRFDFASIVFSTDDLGRDQLDSALRNLSAGKALGKQRSVRMPFTAASYGITITYTKGKNWDEEIIRSAAQMTQGQCSKWLIVQLTNDSPYVVSKIERLLPNQISQEELARGREHIEKQVQKARDSQKLGRNEQCPCGSGKKYKKCHGM